jgi:Mn-containing catalase
MVQALTNFWEHNMTYTKILHDVATGEIREVELTANEIKELQKKQALAEAQTKAEEIKAKAKATAKAELLGKLGITAEEAVLLLS